MKQRGAHAEHQVLLVLLLGEWARVVWHGMLAAGLVFGIQWLNRTVINKTDIEDGLLTLRLFIRVIRDDEGGK